MRKLFIEAARAVTPLLRDDRVAARWREPSALAGLTVGGLAGHLVRALETVEQYLDEPEPAADGLVDAGGYYALVLSLADDDLHRGVRERGEAAAAQGHDAVVAQHEALVARLAARFDSEPVGRRMTVLRGAARITLDDYLPTRLVEVVVHADDLAVSIGAEPPAPDEHVAGVVIDVLVTTARLIHGDPAVVRALTRRERDAVEALRVL